MNDREMMTNLLNSTKGMCDLMMHGAVESSTANVHSAFKSVLSEVLCMQNDIYSKMSEKGWYAKETAEAQRIDTVKQKFSVQ